MAFPTQLQNFGRNVPAPNLPPGTYTGPYAAQGLRTSNPAAAAQLWESRHPGAMGSGNVPPWVSQALMNLLTGEGAQSNPIAGYHPDPNPATGVPHGFGPGGAVSPGGGGVQHLPEQGAGGQMDPSAVLHDVVNYHRSQNGLGAMHPEELHARVTNLAHEILGSRQNRLRRALRSITPGPPMPPSGPVGGPFQAS